MTAPGRISIFDDTAAGRAVYVVVDADGIVTGYNGHVDLGTGIETALAQIVAEELDAPLHQVRIILGDTALTPDQGPTIASETIQVAALPLRIAAAQARRVLVGLAARALNQGPGALVIRDGLIIAPDGARLGFDALVAGQDMALRLDRETPVKDPADYRIVGQPVGRRDLDAKLRGQHLYIHDLDLPGMVHGHVIRPPYAVRDSGDFIGHSLIGWDETSVQGMEGLIAIVAEGDFLGVVAERAEQAARIAAALKVNWCLPPPLPDVKGDGGDLRNSIKDQPATPRRLDQTGDFDAGMAASQTRLRRSYVWPYHLHGSIGPSCAVADWAEGRPVIWSGTQNPHMLRDDLAQLVGLPADTVEIKRLQAAGCYGRNCADDVCGDALLLSRAVGRPVRVQLTRAQEHLWEPRGAAQIMEVEGGLKDNHLHAYALDTWYPSNRAPNLALLLTGRISNEARPCDMGDRTIIPPYRIANKRITVHDMAPVVRAAWMRGVSALPNTFAHESFIDEMAHEAGADPIAFRLAHLDDPRAADLIRRTAEAAGWDDRPRPARREGRMAYGRGFAFATYVHGPFPGTAAASAAWVVDVAVDTLTGEVSLTRVLVGQDQGLVINPDGVRQQIHGNVIQTASRVMTEEIRPLTRLPASWASYPIQTFPAVPEIGTMLIARPTDPALGVGESAAVPSAAAIANAIFDATGVRLREVPFTPERMREGLAGAGFAPALPAPDLARAPVSGRLRRKTLRMAALLGGALTLGAVALPVHRAIPPRAAPAADSFSPEILARGAEVFALGNCTVCHTAPDGAANAGGRAMPTPYGTVWSTNITPDHDTGLGMWSFDAFDRAMRKGVSRDGHNLYPAFPYTSFARLDEVDMFALYAHLQTLPPVRSEAPRARMVAPGNLRSAMTLWNAMFLRPALPEPALPEPATATAHSAQWERGRYLVEGAGHCSACHSPRNVLGGETGGAAHLSGSAIKGWFAPALAGAEAGARGWDEDALYTYLRKGVATPAVASGPMADVVASLRGVPNGDIRAMAVYLASLVTGAPAPAPAEASPPPGRGARLFEAACAACHTPAFPDSAHAAHLPLTQSAVLRAPTPEALKTLLSEGLTAPDALSNLRDMPSFADQFDAADEAALTSYLRARFAPDLPQWLAH